MNQVSKIISQRYSCRRYQNKPIERHLIEELLDEARLAPSAANCQPWQISVIREPENLQKIHQVYAREWFKTAPMVLLICADTQKSWVRADGKNHSDIDIAIFVDHITLLATEKGLATCWVCNFDSVKTSELFNLPDEIKPLVLLPLGYAADQEMPQKRRKELSEFVIWK